MPIYEYKCEGCGNKFEKLVRGSEAAVLDCPACGGKHLNQEYSTFAAHANGAPSRAQDNAPACPGGMCVNPGMCGRN
ncbi:MAG: zinc ribbon domain-containing protein [Acidobacteriota bacterium]|nr:zinc ribbon domain-containing protein [Acidobacteriota bacterium]